MSEQEVLEQLLGNFVENYETICAKTLALMEHTVSKRQENFIVAQGGWPALINLNGDIFWIPFDLLKFIWHTRVNFVKSPIPHFLAETGHYLWARARTTTGMIVFDCGANIGLFSTMFARQVGPSGKVYAFEPDPKTAKDLKRVLALNDFNWVEVVEAAVSDKQGEATFVRIVADDVRREGSHLEGHQPHLTENLETFAVNVVSIDSHVAHCGAIPNIIKIDVEGAEWQVLAGSQRTLSNYHPVLVIEIHPNIEGYFDHQRLIQNLNSYGYEVSFDNQKTYFAS
jgi:FkbM family methyltransferase